MGKWADRLGIILSATPHTVTVNTLLTMNPQYSHCAFHKHITHVQR